MLSSELLGSIAEELAEEWIVHLWQVLHRCGLRLGCGENLDHAGHDPLHDRREAGVRPDFAGQWTVVHLDIGRRRARLMFFARLDGRGRERDGRDSAHYQDGEPWDGFFGWCFHGLSPWDFQICWFGTSPTLHPRLTEPFPAPYIDVML